MADLVGKGYFSDTEEAREEIEDLERSYDCVIVGDASEEDEAIYGRGLWAVRNSGGSEFLRELPYGGWEDLDTDMYDMSLDNSTDSNTECTPGLDSARLHDAGDRDELDDYPRYYEEGEEDAELWEESDIDDSEPLEDLESEDIRYKGYLITGNPSARYVCVSPYGSFSPKSYATIEEAKQAIDEDDKIRWQDHYMPRE